MISADIFHCKAIKQFSIISRVLELLLKHEARPGISDNQGYNAIHYAALKGHRLALEMVRPLFLRVLLYNCTMGYFQC